jgi:transposase
MNDNISKLLGLEDVIVKNVEEINRELHISIELPRRLHGCPLCGTATDRVHDYRLQKVRDCSSFGKRVYLHLRKRRYVCPECGKRFYEKNSFLPRYYHVTQRLILNVIAGFRETVSATHIARENNISVSTAFRYFDLVSYGRCRLPEVLSIDEFKGNACKEKYQCILTDAEHRRILDILPSRKSADLVKFFLRFPRNERLRVKYVVIDMSTLFRNVAEVCFPNAVIVSDRFHVVRQASWALENDRKEEQKRLSSDWRRYCKHSRYLLHKKPEDLKPEEKEKLLIILGLSTRIQHAYELKNDFLEIINSEDSATAKKRLADWIYNAENAALPEFEACTKALHNWSSSILNSFDCPYSNGYTEGCNNKTKVIKRVCFGVRKFARLRNRILHCAA